MILYVDASALVKRYVTETASEAVGRLTGKVGNVIGTAVVSRAEVSAAMGRAVRLGVLSDEDGQAAVATFRRDWTNIVRIRVTEAVVARADRLAWTHGLRGYDAVHLAAALQWQDGLDAPVVLATFDQALWRSGQEAGLRVWPDDLMGGEVSNSPVP